MKKFALTPSTLDRISITPTIIKNGKAIEDDVGMNSQLYSINNTFEDADPSRLNIGVGIGMTGGSPHSIADYPTTNAYLLVNIFLDRPLEPFDNRSWGPVLGVGLTSGLFSHLFVGGQCSISALTVPPYEIGTGIFDAADILSTPNLLVPAVLLFPPARWVGMSVFGRGGSSFHWPIYGGDAALVIPIAVWIISCALDWKCDSVSLCYPFLPLWPINPPDWYYWGAGAARVMAGGDYGAGRNAQCLIGLSYDL